MTERCYPKQQLLRSRVKTRVILIKRCVHLSTFSSVHQRAHFDARKAYVTESMILVRIHFFSVAGFFTVEKISWSFHFEIKNTPLIFDEKQLSKLWLPHKHSFVQVQLTLKIRPKKSGHYLDIQN